MGKLFVPSVWYPKCSHANDHAKDVAIRESRQMWER